MTVVSSSSSIYQNDGNLTLMRKQLSCVWREVESSHGPREELDVREPRFQFSLEPASTPVIPSLPLRKKNSPQASSQPDAPGGEGPLRKSTAQGMEHSVAGMLFQTGWPGGPPCFGGT